MAKVRGRITLEIECTLEGIEAADDIRGLGAIHEDVLTKLGVQGECAVAAVKEVKSIHKAMLVSVDDNVQIIMTAADRREG